MKYVILFVLVMACTELGRIHRHLHVIECKLFGEISDDYGEKWNKSDSTCSKIKGLETK